MPTRGKGYFFKESVKSLRALKNLLTKRIQRISQMKNAMPSKHSSMRYHIK